MGSKFLSIPNSVAIMWWLLSLVTIKLSFLQIWYRFIIDMSRCFLSQLWGGVQRQQWPETVKEPKPVVIEPPVYLYFLCCTYIVLSFSKCTMIRERLESTGLVENCLTASYLTSNVEAILHIAVIWNVLNKWHEQWVILKVFGMTLQFFKQL